MFILGFPKDNSSQYIDLISQKNNYSEVCELNSIINSNLSKNNCEPKPIKNSNYIEYNNVEQFTKNPRIRPINTVAGSLPFIFLIYSSLKRKNKKN